MKRPKILDKFLNSPNSELEALVTHAKQLRRLQGQYRNIVSEDLAKNCQIANFHNGVLTLSCESAAWSTRVKMDKAQLLTTLGKSPVFADLHNIEVITRPFTQPIETKEKAIKISMSRESAEVISGMAKAIADPDIREALQRLARHKND